MSPILEILVAAVCFDVLRAGDGIESCLEWTSDHRHDGYPFDLSVCDHECTASRPALRDLHPSGIGPNSDSTIRTFSWPGKRKLTNHSR